jgi:hypothetical protein
MEMFAKSCEIMLFSKNNKLRIVNPVSKPERASKQHSQRGICRAIECIVAPFFLAWAQNIKSVFGIKSTKKALCTIATLSEPVICV